MRILLAEDNPVEPARGTQLFNKAGHTTKAVVNGREALEVLARESFDLVLMDVQIRKWTAWKRRACCSKEQETGRRIPIVAMTAHAMKGDRERCLEAGMDDYISKPVQKEELFRVVQSAVLSLVPTARRVARTERACFRSGHRDGPGGRRDRAF